MKIKDFFNGKISEILSDFENIRFDTDEFQYSKKSKI